MAEPETSRYGSVECACDWDGCGITFPNHHAMRVHYYQKHVKERPPTTDELVEETLERERKNRRNRRMIPFVARAKRRSKPVHSETVKFCPYCGRNIRKFIHETQ